jgi:hypothetical protein
MRSWTDLLPRGCGAHSARRVLLHLQREPLAMEWGVEVSRSHPIVLHRVNATSGKTERSRTEAQARSCQNWCGARLGCWHRRTGVELSWGVDNDGGGPGCGLAERG